MASLEEARAILTRYWGYDDFRWAQRRVIVAGLTGRDCLAVLPTGGGKSICFQLPALLAGGTTLVVSPLISLMQDQVGALRQRGIAAAYLSSSQKPEMQAAVRDALLAGRLSLLYAAPERLQQFAGTRWRPPMVAVDEAHCISEWGHEFRPHYRAIGTCLSALGRPPVLAVTGTATLETRDDIVQVLGLRSPIRVATGADRPNLRFAAWRAPDDSTRLAWTLQRIRSSTGTAIVYVQTRDRTDGVAGALRRRGLNAAPYHAGLPASARRALLRRFTEDRIRVMVATSAFGMGIDKPDVRLVVHWGVPSRPEAYWQEAGRAGRDGQPSDCVMFWTTGDVKLAAAMAGMGPAAAAGFAAMKRYLGTWGCRREVLLSYLGDAAPRCGGRNCCRAARDPN
ncbi:MAG: ATP-dependent DNA helicase RecQ [Gemmatimonadales bacterium]